MSGKEGRKEGSDEIINLLTCSLIYCPPSFLACGFSLHTIGNFEVLDESETRSGSLKIKGEFFWISLWFSSLTYFVLLISEVTEEAPPFVLVPKPRQAERTGTDGASWGKSRGNCPRITGSICCLGAGQAQRTSCLDLGWDTFLQILGYPPPQPPFQAALERESLERRQRRPRPIWPAESSAISAMP